MAKSKIVKPNPDKSGMIRCDNTFAQFLEENIQLQISEVGCDTILNIINGNLPGMIVFAIPNKDGSKTIYRTYFENNENLLKALSVSEIDKETLSRLSSIVELEKKGISE